ncbi:MAG: carbon monoxide dehydrogenase [Burkholderiales bacterium RIFCSPHIGHO2_12_FULL_69_20]|nr:MAG: carbon monoxide dehydrogenase [Burkholderiales bacterium RIFCSPHIGHO2_12_FULL_69_20]
MQLTNQQTLPVTQAQAWEALNDITLLQSAIPGCEGITPSGEHQYEVLITAAIGPVKAKFKGKLQLENLQPPTSYTLRFEGQGGAAGHGKGHADIRLEATGANQTVLHYTAHATVGGKIAQIGSRLVDMAAQKMATEFFETFNAKLQERYAVVVPEVVAAPAPQGLLARFVAWFKRLFGG